MSLLVSKVDKVLRISKERSFLNKETLVFNFKANVPQEVPEDIAKAYSGAYPHIYSIVGSPEPLKPEQPASTEKTEEVKFDALTFLTQNPKVEEEQLKALKQSELLAICEVLDLKAHPNTGVAKLAAMIAQEVAVQNSKE